MSPQAQAEKIVREVLALKTTDEERFAIGVVLASAGLGVASAGVKTGKVPPMRALSLLVDLRALIKDLENAIKPN